MLSTLNQNYSFEETLKIIKKKPFNGKGFDICIYSYMDKLSYLEMAELIENYRELINGPYEYECLKVSNYVKHLGDMENDEQTHELFKMILQIDPKYKGGADVSLRNGLLYELAKDLKNREIVKQIS